MDDEIKDKINSLVKNMVKLIEKKESVPEIFVEYDEIIELLDKSEIMTKEEFDKLLKDYEELEKIIKINKEQINLYEIQIKTLNETNKSLKEELSKNDVLKEQYKKLIDNYNTLKLKMAKEDKDIYDYQIKLKNSENIINDIQNELNKMKKEIIEKKEKNINLEKEIKENILKINQNNEKIKKLISEKNDLSNSNVELRNKNKEQKISYENKIKILEKQLKHLSDANNNFVQENNEVQTQLKDFQLLTNMAKVNTKKLNKEDFSILEIMSKRAETAEIEVQKLISLIDELKSLNKQIRDKIKPLEDYALLQIKHDHEINISNDTIIDIQNKVFTDEQKKELFKLKNDPNELFQALIKIKTENLELHKHIKDITIECNQQLREAKWKNKK